MADEEVPRFLVDDAMIPRWSDVPRTPGIGRNPGQNQNGPYPILNRRNDQRRSPNDKASSNEDSQEYYTASSPSQNSVESPSAMGPSPSNMHSEHRNMPWNVTDPAQWTEERVQQWLVIQGFSSQWRDKFREQHVAHQGFLDLARYQNLKRLGITESPARFIRLLRAMLPQSRSQPSPKPKPQSVAHSVTGSPVSPSTSSSPINPSRGSNNIGSMGTGTQLMGSKRTSLEKFLFLDNRLRPTRGFTPGPSVLVTADNINFRLVGISRCFAADAVRRRVLQDVVGPATATQSKIVMRLTDYFCVPGEALSDPLLWNVLCAAAGDIVKFFVEIEVPHVVGEDSDLSEGALSPAATIGASGTRAYPRTPTYLMADSGDYFTAKPQPQTSGYHQGPPMAQVAQTHQLHTPQQQSSQSQRYLVPPKSRQAPNSPGEELVALRTAPKPPLARSASSKYRPELSPVISSPPDQHENSLAKNKEDSDNSSDTEWADAPSLASDEASDDGLWAKPPSPKIIEPAPKIAREPRVPTRVSSIPEEPQIQRDEWESRPPTELVYDNLERFFPDTDLDKPVVPTPPRHPPTTPTAKGASVSRAKSIRVVAREASRRLRTSEPSQQNLLRRRSTKLWGQRVVEMRKGQQVARLRDHRQYVWVRGELLGQGTFGKVYLALNATTGDMMAVKQVRVPLGVNQRDDAIKALYAEVENMKDLDHLNIVQYLGFEETRDGVANLFLEYVPGGSVKSLLNHFGRLPDSTIRYLTRQILEGMAYLHSRGILHRDLKADNLLLDIDGTVKISDFGISKRSRDIYANNAEMSMQGTIFWMAPEVISNVIKNQKQGYSAKVDVWSLGCVILEMFVGRRPWSTEEAVGAMYKLGSDKQAPPIPEDAKDNVSREGKEFLDACFVIDPQNRPTARELLEHPFCKINPGFQFTETMLGKALQPRTGV